MADSPKADLWKAVKHPRMRPWFGMAASMPAAVCATSLALILVQHNVIKGIAKQSCL